MELIIAVGIVLAIAGVFARLATTYPVDSRALVADSLVGTHAGGARLWPSRG